MNEKIKLISLIALILPIITVLTSYFMSIRLEFVQFCIPNIDGCTSISRVGRYPPVSFFFKSLMYVSIIVIFLYWKNNYFFLSQNKSLLIHKLTFVLGILSVIFFFCYVFFLGEGNYYKFFRKIGIFIYIFFTIISELLLSISYRKNDILSNSKIINFKFYYNIFLTLLGLVLFPLVVTKIISYPNFKNIASWNYFFLIQINFLLTYFCFKNIKRYI